MKLKRFRDKTRASHLERKFLLLWQSLGGPALEREYRFHPERKWRADFAHLPSRLIVELEGGIFMAGGGRHNRASGFINDAEKHFHAWLLGWSVVRLTAPQITSDNIERIIQRTCEFDLQGEARNGEAGRVVARRVPPGRCMHGRAVRGDTNSAFLCAAGCKVGVK